MAGVNPGGVPGAPPLVSLVQVVQDGTRAANLIAAFPEAYRTTEENQHGILYRTPACTLNSSVVREMAVTAVIGRDAGQGGLSTERRPLAPSLANRHNLQHPSSSGAKGTLGGGNEAADPEDVEARSVHGRHMGDGDDHEEQPPVALTACEVPVGAVVSREVHNVTKNSQVVVSAFVSSVDATARPDALGGSQGPCTADPHAAACADSIALLAEALFRSTNEAGFNAVMNAVLEQPMRPAKATAYGQLHEDPDARADAVPAFVRDWAVPVAPTFTPSFERIPRRKGAQEVIAKAGTSLREPVCEAVASAADLLSVLDIHSANTIGALLKRKQPTVATEPLPEEHLEAVKMAAEATDRDGMDTFHAATLSKHVAFSAIVTPCGFARVHGGDFFRTLSHAERMSVAAFAMCLPATADHAEEEHVAPPPVFSPRESDGAATATGNSTTGPSVGAESPAAKAGLHHIQWAYSTARGDPQSADRQVCVLALVPIVPGVSYVVCVRTAKQTLIRPEAFADGLASRILRQQHGDDWALSRFAETGRGTEVGGGGCCSSGPVLRFLDASVTHHNTPGLLKLHATRILSGLDPAVCVLGGTFGRDPANPKSTPKGLDADDRYVMVNDLDALRVVACACPTIPVAASRSQNRAVSTLVAVDRDGDVSMQRLSLDVTEQQEWQLRPEPECAFVVTFNALGSRGSKMHVSASQSLRQTPAVFKTPYHASEADLSNRHDAPLRSVVTASDDGTLAGTYQYTAPTPVYVDDYPADSSKIDDDSSASTLNSRAISSFAAGHRACGQTSRGAWGCTTLSSSVALGSGNVAFADACARLWMRQLAVRDGSLLRATVNLAFRGQAKSIRVDDSDDDETPSCASTVDSSDYDSDW